MTPRVNWVIPDVTMLSVGVVQIIRGLVKLERRVSQIRRESTGKLCGPFMGEISTVKIQVTVMIKECSKN